MSAFVESPGTGDRKREILGFWEDNRIASKKEARRNREITNPEVRLIDENGEQQGVVAIEDAVTRAEAVGLELVEIAPTAEPPVCRIMDWGKFKFEIAKKQQAAKKKQKQIQVKEVKFRPGTEDGDYQVKLRNLIRFLENGDKAKITIRFRGRELAHLELGEKLLYRIEEDLSEYAVVDQRPKKEGRQMVMMMSPKKHK